MKWTWQGWSKKYRKFEDNNVFMSRWKPVEWFSWSRELSCFCNEQTILSEGHGCGCQEGYPETLYVNQTSSHRVSQLLLSVTPSTNVTVAIQVVWGSLSISGVKTPWTSSLTSSSKRYCTSNVVSHDYVSMCSKKDYGLHCHLFGVHIIHKHLILCLRLTQNLAPRSLRKILHHWPDIFLDTTIHVPSTTLFVHWLQNGSGRKNPCKPCKVDYN